MGDPRWMANGGPFYFQPFPQQTPWQNPELLQVIKQEDHTIQQPSPHQNHDIGHHQAPMSFFQMGVNPVVQPPPAHHNSTVQALNPLYFMPKQEPEMKPAEPSTSSVNQEDKKSKRAEHYLKNREMKLLKQRDYYRRNREERIAKQAEYYRKNREKLKKRQCEYYQKNSEIRKQKQAQYYNQKREKQKEKQRKDHVNQQVQQQLPQQQETHQQQQLQPVQMSLVNNGLGGYQLVIPDPRT